MPSMRGHDLAHDLGLLRIAEIEIVGDGERQRADRGDVAPGFGHRLLGAFERIGLAIARRHIGGDGERPCWCRARAPPPHRRPGICTVSAITVLSYCSHTQRREHMSGEPMIFTSDCSIGFVRRSNVRRRRLRARAFVKGRS